MSKSRAAGGRIEMLSEEEAVKAAEAAGIPSLLGSLCVFRTLLRHPSIARALSDQLQALLTNGKLDARLRELLIMRIGWKTDSVYEWSQHWRIARVIGLSEADIVGVRNWRRHPGFTPADRAVLAATDETLETGTISPQTWAECEAQVGGPQELIELVIAIGNWRLFSSMLRSLDIPLEEGTADWPPDGKVPKGPSA